MMTTKCANLFVAVVAVAWTNAVVAGDWTYTFDGEDGANTREWTECWSQLQPPAYYEVGQYEYVGDTADGLHYIFDNAITGWQDGKDHYVAQWLPYIGRPAIPCAATESLGFWSWRVAYTDAIVGRNVSYWGSPGALDEGRFANPLGKYTTDAGDAALMFLYWGTPIADFTGDAMTDAADAGRLFEEWTGDPAPASVPEPSGLAWFLLAIPMLRKRHNV